jgi:hypothetical protein
MIAIHRAKLRGVTALPALLLTLLPAACLEVSSQEPPMCKTTADCDPGEVCDENVCWGNPPAGALAAVISPPSERADLVSREVLMLPIAGDGWIEDVHLDNAVAFKGRLQAQCELQALCDSRPLAATITIARPSVFNGGPGFHKRVEVDDGTFEINVPATRPDDPPFTITVVPSQRDVPGLVPSLARVLPPMQTRLPIAANVGDNVLELGEIGLPRVYGKVATLSGGLAGYRVVALGRWAPEQPLTEVSTVAFTAPDGLYELRLARGLVGNVEIVARPYDASLRPELHLVGVDATRDSINNVLLLPSLTTGGEVAVDVIVDHKDTGGEIAPVSGARVIIASSYAQTSGSMRLTVEGTTSDDGVVHLKLLDLTQLVQGYKLSIIPPPSSKAAALFEKPYTLQTTTSQRLETRLAVTGTVLSADGQPLKGVSVTARPSVRFLWSLDAPAQAFLGAIPAATMVTPDTGEFVLFVDHALTTSGGPATTVWGHYDLSFEPSMKARAPSWTWTNVELPRDDAQSTLALGDVRLPDAAYVRGLVFDDENARVEGAEVKIYQVQTDEALCQETRFEPPSCPIPPLLLGRGTSDDDGVARLTLPR